MDLKSIRNFLVEQKFRFDVGISFLVFVNFSLLIVTASDHIRKIPIIKDVHVLWLLFIGVFCAFFGVWLFGYILDRFVKYYDQMRKVTSERDPVMVEILERVKKIEVKVDEQKKVS